MSFGQRESRTSNSTPSGTASRFPWLRLSTAVTRWPLASSARQVCAPMNPAPPVTMTCMGRQTYQIARMQFGNSDQDRSNVEDRRGSILSGTGGRLGLGGIIVLGILSLVFKQNLFDVVPGNPRSTKQAPNSTQ